MMWWHGLGVLGSLAVTGPIGLAIAIWLLAGKSWRLTLTWSLLFGVGMALVVATKIAFIGWGVGVESVAFAGISGHAMRAAAVFPVALYLLVYGASRPVRLAALAAGGGLTVLIAISRVKINAHSVSEVVTGCLLGFTVAAAFIWYARSGRELVLSRVLGLLCLPALLIAPRIEPIPTELWITKAALYLAGHEQPHIPYIWRAPRPLD
ncbi:phosphatase PAP2 family protein [Duganella sp. CT11-25]|jgi:membrane-associated phospholipid phosphatase|uniref:phosphatase PAP2 family protein n=1 Tax=unclassified Duganella TaxID=2636909 RepID=UPI0039B0D933